MTQVFPAPEFSGIYETPAGIAALQEAVTESGGRWLEADLGAARTKLAVIDAIALATRLPAHFGRNWDALADSLQDLPIAPSAGCVLRLRGAVFARHGLGAEWETLLEILTDTAMYWKGRGIQFTVFVDGAAELAAWK